jgi:hypothetical protein
VSNDDVVVSVNCAVSVFKEAFARWPRWYSSSNDSWCGAVCSLAGMAVLAGGDADADANAAALTIAGSSAARTRVAPLAR